MDDLAQKTFVKCAKLAKNGISRNTSTISVIKWESK